MAPVADGPVHDPAEQARGQRQLPPLLNPALDVNFIGDAGLAAVVKELFEVRVNVAAVVAAGEQALFAGRGCTPVRVFQPKPFDRAFYAARGNVSRALCAQRARIAPTTLIKIE